MRITREALIKVARQVVQQRVYTNSDILAAYLVGSVLSDEPLLGGTTDVDIIFIHEGAPLISREIVGLSNEVHLDLAHRGRKEYDQPRDLRVDSWLGYELYNVLLLHEKQHFLEFTQAAVRAHFFDPDNILSRSRRHLSHGRQIWLQLQMEQSRASDTSVSDYLRAVRHAVNAIATMSGPPLTGRRLLQEFPDRCEQLGHPGLYKGLVGLLGGMSLEESVLAGWLQDWQLAFTAAAESGLADEKIHTARLHYYLQGMKAYLDSDTPVNALWPLLITWSLSVTAMEKNALEREPWKAVCQRLGLSGELFNERLQGLDHYLDEIEIIFEDYARENGIQGETSLDNLPYLGG